MRIRIVKSWESKLILVIHVWMFVVHVWLWDLHVDYRDIRILYSSLPLFVVWLSCMWFFSYCDDHRFYWCEQMGGLLAVVTVMEMLRLDGLDGTRPLWGPSLKDFISLDFLAWTRPSTIICFFSVFLFGPCGTLFRLWTCRSTEYFMFQTFIPFEYYVLTFLLNRFYLFFLGRYNWHVSRQFFLIIIYIYIYIYIYNIKIIFNHINIFKFLID